MSTAANEASQYEGSGAGGKLRRKPFRKAQATPYDRPPTVLRNPSNGNGWLSKIIDPASKIITASAHRLFSSVFRKRLLPPPQQQAPNSSPVVSQPLTELNRPADSESRGEIQENIGDRYGKHRHAEDYDSLGNCAVNQGLNELEKILEHKTFTKSEIDRLAVLLNSRTIEAPTENDKEAPEARASETVYGNGNMKEPEFTPFSANCIKGKRQLDGTSSPVANTEVFREDIATPAEIAKAYMGSRSSKVSPLMLVSRSPAIRSDFPKINNAVFPSPSPSHSSANRNFPRLMTYENGYMTPRSRGRSAIYSMARTPYSRMQKGSDISKSYIFQSSQLALEPNAPSSSRQMTLKRRNSVLEDDIDSVGPVRRIRQKPLLTPSLRLTGPPGRSSPVIEPGAVSNHRSKDAGKGIPGANYMSVPSQSSEVAQKILQQLDTLAPAKEKLYERKSTQHQGNSSFTLTSDMLTGQAFRSLENVDSAKFIGSSQKNSKLNDSVQRVTANGNYSPQKMASDSNTTSETALNSSGGLSKNERTFLVNAQEDVVDFDDNNGTANGKTFAVANEKVNLVNSSPDNKSKIASLAAAKENTVSDEEKKHVGFHLNNKSGLDQTASIGSPTLTSQPSVNATISSSLFGKVPTNEQSTKTTLVGNGGNFSDKFAPFTFTSSSSSANGSLAIQTSSQSELNNPKSRVPSGAPIANSDNNSTASLYGISTTSTLLSSSPFANNGYAKGSFASQAASSSAPQSDSKDPYNDCSPKLNPSVSPASIPNTTDGSTSGVDGSLFSTPAAPFSASPVFSSGSSFKMDPHLFSKTNGSLTGLEEKGKPASAVSNLISSPFGGVSSGTSNTSNLMFGSVSPIVDNQSLGSVTTTGDAITSQAPTVGTDAISVSQSPSFQFGSSGFSSSPTFGLSGTNTFATASAAFNFSAPASNVFGSNTSFGMNILPSSKEADNAGSITGSTNNLFGSNWPSNSYPVFGSTTSSSSTTLTGLSAASPAPAPAISMPGSIFGSTGASAGSTFSSTSASASTSPSPFSARQPVFGSSNPVFSFASAASPANNGTNSPQISLEDTMAEDTVQASAPSTPGFGQPQSSPGTGFVFGSQSPSVAQSGSLFQFGSQPSPAAPVNQLPFQASTSSNAGSSFSLGTGGGDKSGRRIIKVKKGPKRR